MTDIDATARTRKFMPGDRVSALPGTSWDSDLDPEFADHFRLHGHHGHVVDACTVATCYPTSTLYDDDCLVHVHWEGTHDGRTGPTDWANDTGYVWHMNDDEIEHID